jgi:hypothetical protein
VLVAVGSFWPKAGGLYILQRERKGGKKKASKLQVVTRHSPWMIPK